MNLKQDGLTVKVFDNRFDSAMREFKKRSKPLHGLLRMRMQNPSGAARRRAKVKRAYGRHKNV